MADRNTVWRRTGSSGGQSQPNRPASGSNTPRDRASTPSTGRTAQEGNGPGRGGHNQGNQRGGRRDNSSGANNIRSPQVQAQTPSPTQSGPETHVSVNAYNAQEIKDYMKKAYLQTVSEAGGDEKALLVKSSDSAPPKSAAPWGARPTQMANGQNFWVELAKQLKAGDDQNQKPKASGEQSRKGK